MGECPHIRQVKWAALKEKYSSKEAKSQLARAALVCDECTARMPFVWACLNNNCGFVGCGRHQNRHALRHFEEKHKEKQKKHFHTIFVNLQTGIAWCYACDRELLPNETEDSGLSSDDAAQLQAFLPFVLTPLDLKPGDKSKEKGRGKDSDEPSGGGLVGLENLGNTCYMNAALQCLSNCPPLTNYMLTCSPYHSLRPHHGIVDTYQGTIQALWKEKQNVFSPTDFLRDVKQLNPMFRGYAQQDSQEFLRFFLDRLHEEIKRPVVQIKAIQVAPLSEDGITPPQQSVAEEAGAVSRAPSPKLQPEETGTKDPKEKRKSKDPMQAVKIGFKALFRSGPKTPPISAPDNPRTPSAQEPALQRADEDKAASSVETAMVPTLTEMEPEAETETLETTQPSIPLPVPVSTPTPTPTLAPIPLPESTLPDDTSATVPSSDSSVSGSSESSASLGDKGSKKAKRKHHRKRESKADEASQERERRSSTASASSSSAKRKRDQASQEDGDEEGEDGVGTAESNKEGTNSTEEEGKEKKKKNRDHRRHHHRHDHHHRLEPSDKEAKGMEVEQPRKDDDGQNPTEPATATPTPTPTPATPPQPKYTSVINETFEGILNSTVRCQECQEVSTTNDPFYDLSVPILRKPEPGGMGLAQQVSTSLTELLGFGGQAIKLTDCLEGFFSTEDLTGNDQYYCGSCKTHTNSQKTFRLQALPEILCIHLKRFRHDSYFSSKISTPVIFPLENLNLKGFLAKPDETKSAENSSKYDLIGIINHRGGLGGGHYVAYCLNDLDGNWYEFDDSRVSRKSASDVEKIEAYLLFYRRKPPQNQDEMLQQLEPKPKEPTAMISKLWINRWLHTSNPGPVTNFDFLCEHGGYNSVTFGPLDSITSYAKAIPKSLFDQFVETFGSDGSHTVDRVRPCLDCEERDRNLMERRMAEKAMIARLESKTVGANEFWFIISLAWIRTWQAFLAGGQVPGPIKNEVLLSKGGEPKKFLKADIDYIGVNQKVWNSLQEIYGGGPPISREIVNIYSRECVPSKA